MRKWLGGVGLALGLAGSVFAADVADLIKQLSDPDADTRRAAAKALGEAGGDAKVAVPALVRALKDRDLFVRRFAAQALGEIGPEAKQAVPALQAALKDPRQEVQEAAATALGKLGPAAGASVLASVVRDPDREPEVRRKAAEALGRMGPEARSVLPTLIAVLKGPARGKKGMPMGMAAPNDVRVEVAIALGNIARPSDTAAISALESMNDRKQQRDRTLREASRAALQKIRGRP
jgi:HEAT repeat protein